MASCAYCGSTLLFVKKRVGDLQFCNDDHVRKGALVVRAGQVPPGEASQLAARIRSGLCPVCKGMGPVDVFSSHTIWSAVVLTSWRSHPRVSCRSCGRKEQWKGLLSSLFLGWWGFPWGLIVTPVQVVRNVVALSGGTPPSPSEQLQQMARLQIAEQLRPAGRPIAPE